jgi:histidyl-tRNA synthetase
MELAKLVKNENLVADAIRLIDRKEKIKPEQFTAEWATISDKPFTVWEGQLNDFISSLRARGISNAVYDPYLMRGFDYYTGIVFEVFDKNPENRRALFGGGRYDNLLSLFGGDKIPAVGFGMGDVTMRDVLETYGLLPQYHSSASLYICRAQGASVADLSVLANRLRTSCINVAIDITERKIGDQIKAADKQSIPYIMVVGEEELKTKTYKVKHLATGQETVVTEDAIASLINNQ